MEIVFIVGGLAVVVLWLSLGSKSGPHTRKHPPDYAPQRPSGPPRSHGRGGLFDEATAHPTSSPIILRGPAYVIDGDTIVIAETQIRLFGIDAPELEHPFGKKAKWAMFALCKSQTITAEITDIDDHGRTVAKCFLPDGRDLSAELVRQGLAIDWPKYSGGIYRHLEAPDARKRLWLADARQKGRMHVWEQFEARRSNSNRH